MSLRVLYLVAGHDLVATAGPTRNALSLARAWSLGSEPDGLEPAEVSLAFRSAPGGTNAGHPNPSDGGPAKILEIDPDPERSLGTDDAAIRGMSVGALLRYVRRLRRFVRDQAPHYDVVLEKSWLLSGLLAADARRAGTAAAVLENLVRVPPDDAGALARWKHRLIQSKVRRTLHDETVIAETPELKQALQSVLGLREDRVHVVQLGVNHESFHPEPRAAARAALGIAPEEVMALYFGAFDATHDLEPLLRALQHLPASADPTSSASQGALRVHLLGDGVRREAYEALAAACPGRVVFHGRRPHAEVPRFIAAANLCLAPYATSAFPFGEVAYSTLKIPEAMACARPVASVPSGNVRRLIRPGHSGLLLPNTPDAWAELFRSLPSVDELDRMGRHARDTALELTWARTAVGYRDVCASLAPPGA